MLWELHEQHPHVVAAECHLLLFLQMACEKLCKAHLIQAGAPPEAFQSGHAYIANPPPMVIKQQLLHLGRDLAGLKRVQTIVRHIAVEIEALNPSVRRNRGRPDNCGYSWEIGGQVISPLRWSFVPLRLLEAPAGRTFLKLLRGAIDRILNELER